MRLLWRMGKEALKYKFLYIIAILATFSMTVVNLIAPKILSSMTAVVQAGVGEAELSQIFRMAIMLTGLYLLKILFRFLSNYFAHKAAWNLVEDLRIKVYEKIQSLSLSFFHGKQTGDLMTRVVNDTANFEFLYAHIIPESITNFVTVAGVLIILLAINVKLALLTCLPIPFILFSGWIFSTKIKA